MGCRVPSREGVDGLFGECGGCLGRECPVTTRSGWSNGIWVHETTKVGKLFKLI